MTGFIFPQAGKIIKSWSPNYSNLQGAPSITGTYFASPMQLDYGGNQALITEGKFVLSFPALGTPSPPSLSQSGNWPSAGSGFSAGGTGYVAMWDAGSGYTWKTGPLAITMSITNTFGTAVGFWNTVGWNQLGDPGCQFNMAVFELQGSNDGSNWTAVTGTFGLGTYIITGVKANGTYSNTLTFDLSSGTFFRYYRLVQVGGSTIATVTAYDSGALTGTARQLPVTFGGFGAWSSSGVSQGWGTNPDGSGGMHLGTSVWNVQGSNDNVNWDSLGSASMAPSNSGAGGNATIVAAVANSNSRFYRHYRWVYSSGPRLSSLTVYNQKVSGIAYVKQSTANISWVGNWTTQIAGLGPGAG